VLGLDGDLAACGLAGAVELRGGLALAVVAWLAALAPLAVIGRMVFAAARRGGWSAMTSD